MYPHLQRIILTATALFLGIITASAAPSPTGVWLSDTGRGAIEIKPCGNQMCGHVVWVKSGSDGYGCGKQIIGEVSHESGSTWGGGWIYSPDKKRRYNVELQPLNNGSLKVVGYKGMRFLSKTMIWKPAPANLERCDSSTTAALAKPSVKPAGPAKAAAKAAPRVAAEPAPAAPMAETEAAVEPATDDSQDVAAADVDAGEESSTKSEFNLDDGIEIGDVFSMKKDGNGKCKIKAPFVDLIVDCDRR